MNCYYHPSRPAVAQCPDCGKGLCRKCASIYVKPICRDCNRHRAGQERASYIRTLVGCTIFFIIGCIIGNSAGESPLMIGYLLACLYGGWSSVGKLFANIFIMLDLRSIATYFIVRAVLAILVGLVTTPFYLIYCIYKLFTTSVK